MSENTVDLMELRKPFAPELIGKLPRGGITLDYVGHADVTDRLLSVDLNWKWEPAERDIDQASLAAAVASGNPEIVRMVIENSPPKFDLDRNGNPVGLWIKLTVGGMTRLGYGSVPSSQGDAVKVLIGDALRNAAMRFGVALDLWAKGDRADPTRENATASAGQANRRGAQSAGDVFENAAPARPRQNGSNGNGQRGQVSRPAQQQAPAESLAASDNETVQAWAAKVDEIASTDDADRADAELREVFVAKRMDPATANAIRKAIKAKRDLVSGREMAGA